MNVGFNEVSPHLRAESLHADVASERVDACSYVLVHQVVLLECVASFERLAAMITEIRPSIHMYVVHVTDVVFLASRPIRARGTAGNGKYLFCTKLNAKTSWVVSCLFVINWMYE